jgi:hypothetical protein
MNSASGARNCGRRGFYLASEIQRAETEQAKGSESPLSGLRKAS